MKKIFMIIGLLLIFAGCAPREAPVPVALPVPEKKPEQAKAAWEIQWDKTLAEALKEGRVLMYTTREREVILEWKAAFEILNPKF